LAEEEPSWRAALVTVSDSRAAHRITADESGDLLAQRLAALPAEVVSRSTVPDSIDRIQRAVEDAAKVADLVVLSGGTGLGPHDVTPQAIGPLLDYEVPGMAEAMRAAGLRSTPRAMLSRQVVGVMNRRLVIALPGSPRGVGEGLDAVWEALPHALALLAGESTHAPAPAQTTPAS
jgi:molybdopterin adenylyltransferase